MRLKKIKKLTSLSIGLSLAFVIFGLSTPSLASMNLVYPSISRTAFSGITLQENLPKQFVHNEYYLVRGSVSEQDQESLYVTLENAFTGQKSISAYPVSEGKFEFFLNFPNTGRYLLNLSPGSPRESSGVELRVLSKEENLERRDNKSSVPSSLRAKLLDNQSYFFWKIKGNNNLSRLSFEQAKQKFSVIVSNGAEAWEVDYQLFENFAAGEMLWTVETAKSSDGSLVARNSNWSPIASRTLEITQHHFAELKSDLKIERLNFIGRRNGSLSLQGTSKLPLENFARIIKPTAEIENVNLGYNSNHEAAFIPADENFELNYTLGEEGTYIVEILDTYKIPVLNIPIYVGQSLPVLPDFADFHDRVESKEENPSLLRNQLLNLTNKDRKQADLNVLTLDTKLNRFAQEYADEIANTNHFSHINLRGESLEQRRKSFKILNPVGENLAQTNSIENAHNYLMRSAAHRNNILDPSWTRVGIGISKTNQGRYTIVQEFSIRSISNNPLTSSQIQALKKDIIDKINFKRAQSEINVLTEDFTLSQITQEVLAANSGDTQETLKKLAALPELAELKKRVTTLAADAYLIDLGQYFATNEVTQRSSFREVAIAIEQDYKADRLHIIILLKR